MKIGSEVNAGGRQGKAHCTEREALFLSQVISHRSGAGASDNAAERGAAGGPPRPGRRRDEITGSD